MGLLNVVWFLPYVLKAQFWDRIPIPASEFSAQTVIVTGSNVGLGVEAARHLARLNAGKIILAVRTVVNPGSCQSTLTQRGGHSKAEQAVKGFIDRTAEVGGRTLVLAAEKELAADAHGGFVTSARVKAGGPNVTGERAARLASAWSEELFARLEEMVPGCTEL